jgi:hypothetical protein
MNWIAWISAVLLTLHAQGQPGVDAPSSADQDSVRAALEKAYAEHCKSLRPIAYRRCSALSELIPDRPPPAGENWLPIVVKAKDRRWTVGKVPAEQLQMILFDVPESLEKLGCGVVAISSLKFRDFSLLINTSDVSLRRSALRFLEGAPREIGASGALLTEVRRRLQATSEIDLWRQSLQLDPRAPIPPEASLADMLFRSAVADSRVFDMNCTEISRGNRTVLAFWDGEHPQSGGVPSVIVVFDNGEHIYELDIGTLRKGKNDQSGREPDAAFYRQLAYSLLTSGLGE